ncbi:MAG: hypothetical protein HYU73_18915 [Betaproteobacteria bacterium]|nr:hypothetical protein [Betaproteobacteria bacterium]
MDASLQRAVTEVALTWDVLSGPGDPNTIDLYRHARRVEEFLRLQIPRELPDRGSGVALVELVERHFLQSQLIRIVLPAEIGARACALVDAIAEAGLLRYCLPEQRYIVTLYGWHGCINMAKILRRTYVTPSGEENYTMDQRTGDYSWLANCWSEEIVRGNPWVRYGVSLARLFETNRKGDVFKASVFEDWVPRDSPYWDA